MTHAKDTREQRSAPNVRDRSERSEQSNIFKRSETCGGARGGRRYRRRRPRRKDERGGWGGRKREGDGGRLRAANVSLRAGERESEVSVRGKGRGDMEREWGERGGAGKEGKGRGMM